MLSEKIEIEIYALFIPSYLQEIFLERILDGIEWMHIVIIIWVLLYGTIKILLYIFSLFFFLFSLPPSLLLSNNIIHLFIFWYKNKTKIFDLGYQVELLGRVFKWSLFVLCLFLSFYSYFIDFYLCPFSLSLSSVLHQFSVFEEK